MATKKNEADLPLRKDVRYLGRVLGEVLQEQEGEALFALEEEVRTLAIRRRRGKREERRPAAEALARCVQKIPLEQQEPVLRAFSVYFQLVNLAEQHHRIRRMREHLSDPKAAPQRGSLAAVFLVAKEKGVSAAKMREALKNLQVTLTFTAHPTQASRRTVLEKLYRIARALEDRDRCALTVHERLHMETVIREEITALWQTDEVRHERPTVGDEVKAVLWYLEEVLWGLVPEVPELLSQGFERAYGEALGFVPMPLRLHSWVGGDMDGHPGVTPAVVEDAIRAYGARALRRYIDAVERLGAALSQSTRRVKVPKALLDSIAADAARMPEIAERQGPRTEGEPWRRKLRFIEARLKASLATVELRRALSLARRTSEDATPAFNQLPPPGAYVSPDELVRDLTLVADTLKEAGASKAGERQVRELLVLVKSLGFTVAELELRAPAEDARDAASALTEARAPGTGGTRLLAALERVAAAQREGGEKVCRTLILSMAQTAEDVRAALACARSVGLWDEKKGCARIDIVPLFETLGALNSSPDVLRALLADPVYRGHVKARGHQEVMVGYSDSGKEVGLLAASAALRRAQTALPKIAEEAGLHLRIFHGRGESVARGGGPAQQAILALPHGSVAGRYKATEQGEAMDHKYARPELALRTLELIVGGALQHTVDAQPRASDADEARYDAVFNELAETGRKAYRALVWENPRFVEFFSAATPIDEIARLPIGSRPSKRSTGGLEALRAIPWVFAWTQNRAILPGFYGVGSALAAFGEKPGGEAMLREMYERWPFFHAVIDNVEMVLGKSDLEIARRYADLASPEAREAVWPAIEAEHRRTREWIKRTTGQKKLLDGNPSLQRSISLRNPYVDPMSFLQVELLKCKRKGDDRCDRPLLLTLAGIAAGMRNTG